MNPSAQGCRVALPGLWTADFLVQPLIKHGLRRLVPAISLPHGRVWGRAACSHAMPPHLDPGRSWGLGMKATLYEILDVPEDASPSDIDNAYRDIERHKARLLRSSNSEDTLNRVKFAHQAVGILGNAASRARYDEQLLQQRVRQSTADAAATPSPAEQTTPQAVEVVASADPHPEDVIAWTPSVPEVTPRQILNDKSSEDVAASEFTLPWLVGLGVAGVLIFSVLMMSTIGKYSGSSNDTGTSSSQSTSSQFNRSDAQLGRDAVAALRRLGGSTEVGLTYIQYSQGLIDANATVNTFLESSDAANNATLATNVREAMGLYVTARDIWEIEVDAGGTQVFSGNMYFNKLLRIYPEAATLVEGRSIDVRSALQDAWSRASAATSAAAASVR